MDAKCARMGYWRSRVRIWKVTGETIMATQKIKIVRSVKVNFRKGSARALYYAALAAHDGKPVADFVAAVAAHPPSTPNRGKLKGQQEPVRGWLGWFVRNGYCKIS